MNKRAIWLLVIAIWGLIANSIIQTMWVHELQDQIHTLQQKVGVEGTDNSV